jgi:hypothetical protein
VPLSTAFERGFGGAAGVACEPVGRVAHAATNRTVGAGMITEAS